MVDQEGDRLSSSTIDWRIPRPILYTNNSRLFRTENSNNYEQNIKTIYGLENNYNRKLENKGINTIQHDNWFNSGSSSASSSRTASSGSLLLAPNNLSSLKFDPITAKPPDTQSIASSTHFTLVNGITLPRRQLSTCTKCRPLPLLVIIMTILLFCGVLAAIVLVEMRAMELRHP